MRSLALLLTGLLCTVVWLVLLVATGFSILSVAIGLVGVLMLMGRSEKPIKL
jgi:hypothetical protein